MAATKINSTDIYSRKRIRVLETEMSYIDTGEGDPIVFLHGNPTSSYIWRNIIPHLADLGRCLAPDLVGMGKSGKSPANAYKFADHSRYLDAWFESLNLTSNVTLVVHDWGGGLGFHRAFRFPEHIRAVAYMEAIVMPMRWEQFGEAGNIFRALRSPAGERMILDENFFIETILPRSVMRTLGAEEMAAYRAPFLERESRLPTLTWPRQIPIDGEPADVTAIVEAYSAWLSQSAIPKLLILGEPGAIITGQIRESCRTWKNQTEVTVKGRHFLQEDSPTEIGEALKKFVKSTQLISTEKGEMK